MEVQIAMEKGYAHKTKGDLVTASSFEVGDEVKYSTYFYYNLSKLYNLLKWAQQKIRGGSMNDLQSLIFKKNKNGSSELKLCSTETKSETYLTNISYRKLSLLSSTYHLFAKSCYFSP